MHTKSEMDDAINVIASIIDQAVKAQCKFAEGTSQYTLQKNRIAALHIASSLIAQESAGNCIANIYSKKDLEKAVAPLASLISKSEKAQQKLNEDTWQYKMLENNLKALYIASPLLNKALSHV